MQTSFFEEADNSTLWGLFVNAGYLTVTKEIDLLKGKYCIEIPNKEVKQEFIISIRIKQWNIRYSN